MSSTSRGRSCCQACRTHTSTSVAWEKGVGLPFACFRVCRENVCCRLTNDPPECPFQNCRLCSTFVKCLSYKRFDRLRYVGVDIPGRAASFPAYVTHSNLYVAAAKVLCVHTLTAYVCCVCTSLSAIPSRFTVSSHLSRLSRDCFSRLCAGSAHYVELSGCQSVVEVQKTIGQHAENNPDLPWVVRAVCSRRVKFAHKHGVLCAVTPGRML